MRKNPFEIKTRFRIIKPSGFIYAYPILRPQNSYGLNFAPAPISLNSEACFFGSDEIANKSLRQGFSYCELSAELQSLALNAKNNFRDYCFNLLNNSEKACFFGSEANGNKTKNKRQFV